MNRYVCIHAHFYQPPRENPWLEAIELQDSAYPYHDWNERISAECYMPNTSSRILDGSRKIIDIVNNYSRLSFNFGPTLMSWIKRKEPELYAAIIEADRKSRELFSGHGSAIAQVYNHMIMPLANERDKKTQVVWGKRDFESHFGRPPEGMWLAETAVDIKTLETLAENEIKFTILAPHQAKKVRKIGDKNWRDAKDGFDPRRPYLCRLPSGKTINIFFYDGPISHEIAFGDLLKNGENFANALVGAFQEDGQDQLVHIATDGETYGHHHRFGDMALAFCLHKIESGNLAAITNYGQYLERHPTTHEAEIFENSSWSCVHGVERWRDNCGCSTGMHHGWQQGWREPLRGAMDWLRDNLAEVYESQMSLFMADPWKARDDYINVMLERSPDNVAGFLQGHSGRDLSEEEKVKALKLLEMQRHAMLMYTSCGWFFDEISDIETVQIMRYASRAMQLAKDVSGVDLEHAYMEILKRAPSNIRVNVDGAHIYEMFIVPSKIDLLRVGAHFAISSLFEKYPETIKIYSYTSRCGSCERVDMGRQKLSLGSAYLRSDIVEDENKISFAVVHLGDQNLFGGVREYLGDEQYDAMQSEIKDAFSKGNVTDVISLIDKHFVTHNYSLWHLFKDEQRKILKEIMAPTLKDLDVGFRRIFENNYPILQVINELKMPAPRELALAAEFILNEDLRSLLEAEEPDFAGLQKTVDEIKRWFVNLDSAMLSYVAGRSFKNLMTRLSQTPDNTDLMNSVNKLFDVLNGLPLDMNLWKAQNIYFNVGQKMYSSMKGKAGAGDEFAKKWIKNFDALGSHLQVRIT